MKTETTKNNSDKKNIFNFKKLKTLSLKGLFAPKTDMSFDEWQELESTHRAKTESAYMAYQSYRIF